MKHILTIFIFIIPFCLFANSKTDSLKNIVHEYEKKTRFETDTNYIIALINVAEELKISQPDTSLLFSNKAYELSKESGYSRGVLKSLLSMTQYYVGARDIEKQLQIANEMLPIAEKIDRKSLNNVYNMLGIAYISQGASDKTYFPKAEEMFKKALSIAEEYADTVRIINILGNLACVYMGQDDYSSALEGFYRAVGLAERSQVNFNTNILLCNIANIYQVQDKLDKALVEIQKAIEASEKNNDIIQLGRCLQLAGNIYIEQNNLEEALEYTNKSVEIFQQLGLTRQVATTKESLVEIYIMQGLLNEALSIAYEILETWKTMGLSYDVAFIKAKIAKIYYEQKQYTLALRMCNEILEVGTDDIKLLVRVHSRMSMIYEAQYNGMKALEHFKQYKIYSDSLYHNDFDEKIINLEAQNKYEKKEMELKAEQALKDAGHIKDKARLQLVIMFVFILFLSVLIFLIFISQSKKKLRVAYLKLKEASEEIQLQKEEISMQSEELRTTNEHLVKLIKFKQDISGMIVHDLKNPLSIMLGLTTSVPDEQRLALLHDSAHRMLNLVLNILDINKYEDSKLELKYTRTDINDLIKFVTKNADISLNFRQLKVNLNLQDGLIFSFDKDIIIRVLDNILNNAIKFSSENETIHISTVKDNNNVRVTVRNVGEPIPVDMQEAIFEPYGRVDRKENDTSVKSTGLGLTFCRMAVMAHNGTIGVKSSHDNPTDFWFTLPY